MSALEDSTSTNLSFKDIDFSRYQNNNWNPGRSKFVILLWRLIGMPLIKHLPCCTETYGERFFNFFRIFILKLFGAKIGKNVVIRACEVYFPWNLQIGNNVWIGFESNLYSLVPIYLGNNTCVSQRAFLCTGSHDVSDTRFSLLVGEIKVCDGAWVSANCFVGPGVTIEDGAVAAAGSVVVKNLPKMTICAGNPCKPKKDRIISM